MRFRITISRAILAFGALTVVGLLAVILASDMASALQVFKENSLRVQAMETAHAKQTKQAEQDRKAGMLQVADGFEKAVGRIIRTVSSASCPDRGAVAVGEPDR